MTTFKFWIFYFEATFYFDVFTKEILAYRIAARKGDRYQYINGLEDVKELLKGHTEPVVLHTDQGSVYASKAYKDLLKDSVIVRSMSRAGKPTDEGRSLTEEPKFVAKRRKQAHVEDVSTFEKNKIRKNIFCVYFS